MGAAPYQIGPRTVGWALAGAGSNAAPRFVQAVRELAPWSEDGSVQARIVGVFSHSRDRAGRFADVYQIAHATSAFDELLERHDVGCVYVANHPRNHRDCVQQALQAGKHVLCEPPLAFTSDDARILYHSAQDRGLTLAVNYQHRLDPGLVVARHLVADGDLGDLVGGALIAVRLLPPALQARRADPAWGGVLFEDWLRVVDALRFITGERPDVAAASAGPSLLGERGLVDLHGTLRMARTRAIVHGYASWQVARAKARIELFGSLQTLRINPWSDMSTSRLSLHDVDLRQTGSGPEEPLPAANLWALAVAAFHHAVHAGAPPPAGADDEIVNLCVAHALARSLASGAQTAVDYPHDFAGSN